MAMNFFKNRIVDADRYGKQLGTGESLRSLYFVIKFNEGCSSSLVSICAQQKETCLAVQLQGPFVQEIELLSP